MPIIILITIALSGLFISAYYFRNSCFLEKLGLAVFFAITVVPFININLALFSGIYIGLTSVLITALCSLFLIILVTGMKFNKAGLSKMFLFTPLKGEIRVLAVLLAALTILFFYYSNIEFLLSLASFLGKGAAPCFYMQTFRTVGVLNPGLNSLDSLKKVYDIICTPGNVLFTSTFLPILKINCFKIIYLISNFILLIFAYLICNKLVKNKAIALVVSLFSVFNPYVLSVEVLDRNVLALSISLVLFYVLSEHKEKRFLQGLIFGIMAGTGLRFLPLVFIVPIFILWGKDIDLKRIALFTVAFFISFLFNLPHFFFNGLSSLGESSSFFNLLFIAFTKWERTPFLPFPNLIFYLVNIVNYFGLLISGIICFGAYYIYRENKRMFSAFLVMFFLAVTVLSCQRNWLEGDKYRIVISAFLPLYIFLAFGLKALSYSHGYAKKAVPLLVSFLLPVIFLSMFTGVDFNHDAGFYQRKCLYQKEAGDYYRLVRSTLLRAGLLPDYKRLFLKLDLKRKSTEEALTQGILLSESKLPNPYTFEKFYAIWKTELFKTPKILPLASVANAKDYKYIRIDFDKLANNTQQAVTQIASSDIVSLDLSSKSQLSEVFYAQFDVAWQKNTLPVCVILNHEAIDALKELTVDLNAFVSLGKDELGCDIVNSINFTLSPFLKEQGLKTGLRSFPLYEENKSLIVKIPADLKIIIKNWFINEENGVPFKVDSWLIKRDSKSNWKVFFFYNEPESYL
jgi:hypothetical protein